MKEINVKATIENISAITDFINNELDLYNCPEKEKIKIDIVIDELITNIAKYAYGSDIGDVTFQVEIDKNNIYMKFIDSGIPYNPMEHAEPDVSLSVEDRPVGGLGIFLVKKLMDKMEYGYIDEKNILKIQKCF